MCQNLTPVQSWVSQEERYARNGHAGGVVWLTGLPGAGKSTLAMSLERSLFDMGYQCYMLDGDSLRSGLSAGLSFSAADRSENLRRAAVVAKMFADSGSIVIAAFISPLISDRMLVRQVVGNRFFEVYINAPISTCEARDPKGLYRLSRAGKISNFTGVSAPYEAPIDPDLEIDTACEDISLSADRLVNFTCRSFPKLNA